MLAGIDIGGTNIHYVIEKGNKIITKGLHPTGNLEEVVSFIGKIIKRYSIKKIGIGVAGDVDCRSGILRFAPNLSWQNVNLKEIFKKNFGVDAIIDNDANCAALWVHKKLKERYKNLVLLTLGTGVGGGLIIDGKPYHSQYGSAAELGHIVVKENGRKCNCGGRGCLEAYVGAHYIRKRIKRFGWDLKDLTENAKKRDKFSLSLYKEIGYWLGIASVTFINIFAPDVICFTGGVSGGWRFFIKELKRVVRERAFPYYSEKVKFLRVTLSMYSGSIGALYLTKE